jgi:hypothetical protein
LLKETENIFDANSATIIELISERKWQKLILRNRIIRILEFVKNEIVFGFTPASVMSASRVLSAGRGHALTKSILLKTLLDSCDVLCRFHAFHIKKDLYKGLLYSPAYHLLPDVLLSCWIEVFYDGQWLVADGVLLDRLYMDGLEKRIKREEDEFIGMGAAVFNSGRSCSEWDGKNHSYCQRASIIRDVGVIEDFEWFFSDYKKEIRHLLRIPHKHANRVIASIRKRS